MNDFDFRILESMPEGLSGDGIETLQVNLGRRCNLACTHCHLECSPERMEMMAWPTMQQVIGIVSEPVCRLVDVTGGSPELHPDFLRFISALSETGKDVQVRTNFVSLLAPNTKGFMQFLAEHEVNLVGSLPCYLEENVRAQRGAGVYEKTIEAIRSLNELGYGSENGLQLNLVYNPGGAFLPGRQADLEADYKRELGARFGVRFNQLLVITNMPIGRFEKELRVSRKDGQYMRTLIEAFNSRTLEHLMCRRQVCVDWDGKLYDCDFNLALGLGLDHGSSQEIVDFDPGILSHRKIVTGPHCFGCTSGAGSSCAGTLLPKDLTP